jgi:hypothetical protein
MDKVSMPKVRLEALITQEVRRLTGCEGFKSLAIYRHVDPVDADIQWAIAYTDYGEAAPDRCETALRELLPRIQSQYSLQPR